jgi:hypothetical protein
MNNHERWNDGTLGLLLLGLVALGMAYGCAIWHLWKWVESGYK